MLADLSQSTYDQPAISRKRCLVKVLVGMLVYLRRRGVLVKMVDVSFAYLPKY